MPARMKLSSVYSTLPPAERKVADFILANPDAAAHMVINEIAHHAGVSVPSVTRLARKLGYDGFMDFRVSLASSTSAIRTDYGQPISSADPDDVMIRKIMTGHMSALDSTMRVLDTQKFSELASEVLTCRRVVWPGTGNCVDLANTFSDSFCRIGVDSVVVGGRGIMHKYAACTKEGDLVFALTRTGKTQRTIDGLRIAKEHGAKTVLITNLVNSPGEQYADYCFCTSRQDELYRICGYETITSFCALLETLLTIVERKKGFSSKAHFLETMTSQK